MTMMIRLAFAAALLALTAGCEGLDVKPLPPEDRPEIASPQP